MYGDDLYFRIVAQFVDAGFKKGFFDFVIGVERKDVFSASHTDSIVPARGKTLIILLKKLYFLLRILHDQVFNNLLGMVRAAIIHDDDLNIAVGLLNDALNRLAKIRRLIETGNHDGD